MTTSGIGAFVHDCGWKGASIRSLGMFLVYLGFLYLPAAVSWASIHLGTSDISKTQVRKHEAILYVVRIIVVLVISIEGVRILALLLKAWRR